MNIRILLVCLVCIVLTACAKAPLKNVAGLTANSIESLEKEIQAKIEAEKAFSTRIVSDKNISARWNVKIQTEMELMLGIMRFTDLTLTERMGVPRIELQEFLRLHNESCRTAVIQEAKVIAEEEARLAVALNAIVSQRNKWREAREATLKLARSRSSQEQFNMLIEKAKESWKIYEESLKEAQDKVVNESVK